MASKKKIIDDKLNAVQSLQTELDVINRMEPRRLYHFSDKNWYKRGMEAESWGYIEAFNKESVRVLVVASSADHYQLSVGRHRGNIISYGYTNLYGFRPVRREDLPLLIGLEFKAPELDDVLSGKSKIKLD